MRIRDKEYQSFGINELKMLSDDYPSDEALGKAIRAIIRDKTSKEMYEYYNELQRNAT